jgi:hypothetical protein
LKIRRLIKDSGGDGQTEVPNLRLFISPVGVQRTDNLQSGLRLQVLSSPKLLMSLKMFVVPALVKLYKNPPNGGTTNRFSGQCGVKPQQLQIRFKRA